MTIDQSEAEDLAREAATPLFQKHPLPWTVIPDDGSAAMIDDSKGSNVLGLFSEEELEVWPDTVTKLNEQHARITALEAALVDVARLFDDGSSDGWEGYAEARAILDRVGLAYRLPGNAGQVEEAVA